MRQTVLKILTCIVVFFAAIWFFSFVVDNSDTEVTAAMEEASFPVVSFESGGYTMNTLHGYAERMDSAYVRETITPLGEDRQLYVRINKYNAEVKSVSYEVRSIDSSRLIEDTQITDYQETEYYITATLSVKDLIETDEEYTMILKVTLGDGTEVYYYTRIIYGSSLHTYSKLSFVLDFHETTFDKENIESLKVYMESDSRGDNTTLARVDIHSSLDQLSWGTLAPEQVTDTEVYIREMQSQTASIELSYLVASEEGKSRTLYRVEEYFRIRYGSERCYLLDYERTMTELPDTSDLPFSDNRIALGICDGEVQLTENSSGSILAYVLSDHLYTVNISEEKYTDVFAFYDGDERTAYNAHDIKILDLDDDGNLAFMVYGYMNRGRHEGQVGVMVMYYDATLNRCEEYVFLPYDRPYVLLREDVEQLAYVNDDGSFYLYLDGCIYDINLYDRSFNVLKTNISENSFRVSDDNEMLVWQNGDDPYDCEELILMNLSTKAQTRITAGLGNRIAPVGFMGDDLIYGLARYSDIVTDANGNVTFPMYILYIRSEDGTVLKTYEQEGIYVTGTEISSNLLTLYRAVKKENGTYQSTYNDQIMNNVTASTGYNAVTSVVVERYETIWRITMKKAVNSKSIKTLSPKNLILDVSRQVTLDSYDTRMKYYVYAGGDVIGTFLKASQAVRLADENYGVVINSPGKYVWVRANRQSKNQIMKMTAYTMSEGQSTAEACLDVILMYYDLEPKIHYGLSRDLTVTEALEKYVDGISSLDLTGCSLDEVLYYVDKDLAVLALLDDEYVLITGFNSGQIVILDPADGTLAKKSTEDMAERFEESGNVFITYIPEGNN